jgi:predicted aldo/keto reductase-like oxidoreductase
VVRGVSGQSFRRPTERGDVECGVCVERCPFDVEIIAKMREAAALIAAKAA